jgi:hypothetical protein
MIMDWQLGLVYDLAKRRIHDPDFDLPEWYHLKLLERMERYILERDSHPGTMPENPPFVHPWRWPAVLEYTRKQFGDTALRRDLIRSGELEFNAMQIGRNSDPGVQRNAASVKHRIAPRTIVISVKINGQPARALVDTGSMGDFISTTLADQLKVKKVFLDEPLSLLLAVQGSRSKINSQAKALLEYADIKEERTFDIVNLSNYDVVLGTPWMFQHKVWVGFNPARMIVGSDDSMVRIQGSAVRVVESRAMAFDESEIDLARNELIRSRCPRTRAKRRCRRFVRFIILSL